MEVFSAALGDVQLARIRTAREIEVAQEALSTILQTKEKRCWRICENTNARFPGADPMVIILIIIQIILTLKVIFPSMTKVGLTG